MKLLNKLRGKIALAGLFALLALGLGSCANPLVTPGTDQNAGGASSMQIRFSAGDARTLIPSAGFEKYVLSFAAAGKTQADVTLTGDDALAGTKDITLDPADWTITVKGYANAGDADADYSAIGTATVTLGAGQHAVVPITLSPYTSGANGTFQYSITLPPGATTGNIYMYDSGGTNRLSPYYFNTDQNNISQDLSPGYYRLSIVIYDSSGGQIARSEIVHIYPELTTEVNYTFTADDFGPIITIDGIVDLNGLDNVNYGYLVFFPDSDYSYYSSENDCQVNSSTGEWSVNLAAFNSPTPLYLELYLEFNDGSTLTKRIADPITVYNEDLTVPTLGPFPVNQYTIGGILDLSGIIPYVTPGFYSGGYYGRIYVYADDGTQTQLGYGDIQENGGIISWETRITADAATLPVIIQWLVPVSNSIWEISEQRKVTLSGNTSGLNFAPSVVTEGVSAARETPGSGYNDRFLFVPESTAEYILRVSGTGSTYFQLSLYDLNGNDLGNSSGSSFTEITRTLTTGTPYIVTVYSSGTSSYQFLASKPAAVTISGTVDLSGIKSAGITVDGMDISINGNLADNIDSSTGIWSTSATVGTTAIVDWNLSLNGGNGYLYGSILAPITGSVVTVPTITPVVISGDSVTQAMQTNQYGDSNFIFVPATNAMFRLEFTSAEAFRMGFNNPLLNVDTGSLVYPDDSGDSYRVVTLEGGKPYIVEVWTDPENTGYTFTANVSVVPIVITWAESSFDAEHQYREFTYTIPAGGSLTVRIADSDNYAEFGKSPINSQDVRYQITWANGAGILSLVDNAGTPTYTVTNNSTAPREITVRVVPYSGPGTGTGTFYVGTSN
ncbi:hypothetical protein AGMMS50293_22950 [Spirochaetia bacterium]|nr:hypothetical protein AGMMS50293_22950 [Spirochaetia bacterium]